MDCIRPVIEIVTGIGTVIGILTCLWPCCVTHANYLCKLQENGDSLEKALNELKNERDDVQKKVEDAEANPNVPMKRKDKVNRWLQSVTAIEGKVVEILPQVDQQTSRRCLGGCCPDNCWSGYMVGRLIVQYIASLDELRKKGVFEEVADKLPPPSVQEEPTSPTVGMQFMLEKAWRLIGEDKVRIMGLYGQGGVGKTTLLKQINNKFLKTTTNSSSNLHGFDVVILVVVSKEINIDAIQKEIGNRLGLSSPNEKNIRNALSKKNFLLLLDDIWERVDLQSIGIPPPHENTKSKVVFTTRSEAVCGLMEANEMLKVECLPWNEAWGLFQEKVGERALNSFPRARELAKNVARECGGLPLALITIGRAMFSKKTVQEWNHAITTLQKYASEFQGMGGEVLPSLKLSYDYLPNHTMRSCFLYCALFPEDHSIDKTKLIDYWIGEGLISLNEFNHIDEARNHGYDVIGILKGAGLLESGVYGKTQVKMHDVIRDLALWVAHDCGSKRDKICIIDSSDLTVESSWDNAERIYLNVKYGVGGFPPPPPPPPPLNSPNLLTLIHTPTPARLLIPNFFEFTPLLRVLDLFGFALETFPTSITELLELRYLSLSATNIKELPEELGKLVKLNYLDLSRMIFLKKIPSGVIGSLVELRVLNLLGSLKVDWDIEEMYKLKHLNDLGIIIKTQHNLNKLLSNKNLQMCTRRLNLIQQSEDVKPQSTSSSPIITLEKLLQLLFNLETLRLEQVPEADQLMNMGIEQQQKHLGSSSCFQNLGEINISHCNGLKDLIWVGYVPNLKTLFVYGCEELEEIISSSKKKNKMMNNVEDIFKSLETLTMSRLPKLKSICRKALAFPCLETMTVFKCPQLKKLTFHSGSNLNNTLRRIEVGPKWWSELQWEEKEEEEEEEEEEDNNNNNELLKSKFLPYLHTNWSYDI